MLRIGCRYYFKLKYFVLAILCLLATGAQIIESDYSGVTPLYSSLYRCLKMPRLNPETSLLHATDNRVADNSR
jgi:hypothetical protein